MSGECLCVACVNGKRDSELERERESSFEWQSQLKQTLQTGSPSITHPRNTPSYCREDTSCWVFKEFRMLTQIYWLFSAALYAWVWMCVCARTRMCVHMHVWIIRQRWRLLKNAKTFRPNSFTLTTGLDLDSNHLNSDRSEGAHVTFTWAV